MLDPTVRLAVLYFAAVLILTWGVTTSRLLSTMRIASSVRWGRLWQAGIYCPVCVGAWIATALSVALWDVPDGLEVWERPIYAIALLIVFRRIASDSEAVQMELDVIDELREDG